MTEVERWKALFVDQRAEVEHLREENAELRSNVEAWVASHGKAMAEVERLREGNKLLSDSNRRLHDENDRLRAERDHAQAMLKNRDVEFYDLVAQANERDRRITRYRKAVNWLIGALETAPKLDRLMASLDYSAWYHDTRWDVTRGHQVLDEEAE